MNLTMIGYAVMGVAMLLLWGELSIKSHLLESSRAEYAALVSTTRQMGLDAKAKADAEIKRQTDNLTKTEKNYAKAKSDLATVNAKLRDANTSRSYVPAAPAASNRPDLACFERAELSAAIKQLVGDVSGIAEESDENTLSLNAGKEWAQGLKPSTQ